MSTFKLNKTQKTSRILLGVIFCLSVIGLPIGIWLFILSARHIKVNNNFIHISPLGKQIQVKEIKRLGIGSMTQLMPGNSALNPSSTPSHVSVLIMLLELKSGKQIRIPLANYETGLSQEIIKVSGLKAKPLINSKLFPWKVSFRD